jgi:hypothetical protein
MPPPEPPPAGGDVTFTDGHVLGNWELSSVSAVFVATDVGLSVVGPDFPAGTAITTVNASGKVDLSVNPTAKGTGLTFTIKGRTGGPVSLNTCGFTGPTYQPGTYTGSIAPGSPGCLATGTYYLPAGATLGDVTAEGTFSDGAATTGSKAYASTTAVFTPADVGKTIVSVDLPVGTTISAVTNATTITLSAATTGTTSPTFSILNRDAMFTDGAATNGSTAYTSATATFTAADVGKTVMGADIVPGTTIAAVAGTTEITLSTGATATAAALTFKILERAGVLIDVVTGDLTVGPVNLAPLTSGADAGITILMDRANPGAITFANASAVNGMIYAAVGSLLLQPGVRVTATAVNVRTLTLRPGSSLVLP